MYTFDEAIFRFKEDFAKIKNLEIESHRISHTGIGKTFEDIIGIIENNSKDVDYLGHIELKSQREFAQSMLTLFTKSPTNGRLDDLVEAYGSQDNTYPNIKCLHTTIFATHYNNFKGKYGFKFEITSDRIILSLKDLASDRILDQSFYWDLKTLRDIIEVKCKNIAYITAKSRIEAGKEYFVFTKAILLSGLTYDKFMTLFKEGTIRFDIRNGVYKTGKKADKKHDHGAAFRIPKRNIELAFDRTDL